MKAVATTILFLVAYSMLSESAVTMNQTEAEDWSLWKQVMLLQYGGSWVCDSYKWLIDKLLVIQLLSNFHFCGCKDVANITFRDTYTERLLKREGKQL